MKELEFTEPDLDVLRSVFAARVSLAQKTEAEAVVEVKTEHANTLTWISSNSQKDKSFLWFCDIFDLDPGSVRKAIAEKKGRA